MRCTEIIYQDRLGTNAKRGLCKIKTRVGGWLFAGARGAERRFGGRQLVRERTFGACFARNKIVFDQIEPKAIICQDRLRTNTDEESCTKKALFGREEELAEACREVRERKTACQCFSIVVFCQDRLGTTTDRKPSKKAAVFSNAGVRHPS